MEMLQAWNRAVAAAVHPLLLMVAAVLVAFGGICLAVFKAVVAVAHPWLALGLLPLLYLLVAALLLAFGVFALLLQREGGGSVAAARTLVVQEGDRLLFATYLLVPVALGYLALWLVAGVWLLLAQLPLVGEAVMALTSFLFFAGVVVVLVVAVALVVFLFLAAPLIAYRDLGAVVLVRAVVAKVLENPACSLARVALAALPLFLAALLLVAGSAIVNAFGLTCTEGAALCLQNSLQAVPAALLLAPCALFFFSLAGTSAS